MVAGVVAELAYLGKDQMGLVEELAALIWRMEETAALAVKLEIPEVATPQTVLRLMQAAEILGAVAEIPQYLEITLLVTKPETAQSASSGPEQPAHSHLPTLVRHKD